MPLFTKNLLAEQGYEMIALPRTDIKPLQLLCRMDEYLEHLPNSVTSFFRENNGIVPTSTANTANISGQQMLDFSLASGLDFFNTILKTFGLNDSEFNAALKGSKHYKIEFTFEDVEENKVDHLALDQFISGGIPQVDTFKSYADSLKKGDLFIVTSTLKSNRFSIKLLAGEENEASLNASLEKIAKVNAQIEHKSNNLFSITTTGKEPLVFACKYVQVLYNKAHWWEFWKSNEANFRIKNQKGMLVRGEEAFPVKLLQTPEGISKIRTRHETIL